MICVFFELDWFQSWLKLWATIRLASLRRAAAACAQSAVLAGDLLWGKLSTTVRHLWGVFTLLMSGLHGSTADPQNTDRNMTPYCNTLKAPTLAIIKDISASSIKHPAMAQGNSYWRNLQPHLMTITLHYHVSWLNGRDYPLRVAGDCQWVVSLSFCLCFQLFQCLWETCLVKNWLQYHLEAKQIDLQRLA